MFSPGTTIVKFNFFYDNGGKALSSDSFPDTVKYVEFNDFFTNGGVEISKDMFPANLETLIFGDDFTNGNKPLNKNSLPDKLTTLKFGYNFNNGGKPLDKGILPKTITTLEFGYAFNNGYFPLDGDILPTNIKNLTFKNSAFTNYGCPLYLYKKITVTPAIITQSIGVIKTEIITNINRKVSSCCKHIIIDDTFNGSLDDIKFHDRIESITFSHNSEFNAEILPTTLPKNLKTLEFGHDFNNGNKPLQPGIFPKTLNELIFGNGFNNGCAPLENGVLPRRLKKLQFGATFNNDEQSLAAGLFYELDTLKFADSFNNYNIPLYVHTRIRNISPNIEQIIIEPDLAKYSLCYSISPRFRKIVLQLPNKFSLTFLQNSKFITNSNSSTQIKYDSIIQQQ